MKAYSRRSSLFESARGSASSRRTSAGNVSWAFVSSAISARSQNTGPMTLACCRVSRSGAGRPSSLACRTPVSVGGTLVSISRSAFTFQTSPVSIAPWSISILTSSSM